eukprot:5519639-Prymnesium_polylepis.1
MEYRRVQCNAMEYTRVVDDDTTANDESSEPAPASQLKIMYGASMSNDPRLLRMLAREKFFLSRLIPQRVMPTWSEVIPNALVGVGVVLNPYRTSFIAITVMIYLSLVISCAVGEEDHYMVELGRGGPADMYTYKSYVPAVMNSLATLLLAFYSNVRSPRHAPGRRLCVTAVLVPRTRRSRYLSKPHAAWLPQMATGQYKDAYLACTQLRRSVMSLMTLAVGTMGNRPEATGMLGRHVALRECDPR